MNPRRGEIRCDGHTWGLARQGWTGGPPHISVFILARAPLVAEGRVTGVYKWRETDIYIYIYSRAARPHVESYVVQVCREDVY